MIRKVKSRTDVVDSTLERRKPRSSVRHRIMLEREESRSSVDCTLPEVLQALHPLERQTPRSSGGAKTRDHARA